MKHLEDLKVALVHDSLTVPAGGERVLWEFHQLFPHAPIYTPLYKPEKFPEYRDVKVFTSGLNKWGFARNHHQLMIPLLPYHIEQFDLSEYDLVISDSSAVAKGVITRPDTIHICYCHTPMRWAWMPSIDKRASSSLLARLAAHYLRIWDMSTVNRVDAWIGNSKTIVGRIKKFYNRDAVPMYPPVQVEKMEPSHESEDFYLTVGRLIPGGYKRTDVIIEGAKKAGVKLVVAGDGPLLPAMKKLAGNSKLIQFVGRVSDEERNRLYSTCKAFIFAAEEDAGIVPIEAMAYGKPVIVYGKGGASETVLNGKTGLHFKEQTADSLALAIQESRDLAFDPLVIAKHAQQFSATRFRQEMMDFIIKTIEEKASRQKDTK